MILLGSLFSELQNVDTYQKHRINETWIWPENDKHNIEFQVIKPTNISANKCAINVSLSAEIPSERITNILGENAAIWTIRIKNPNQYFVTNKKIQDNFKIIFKSLLEDIKKSNKNIKEINIFPAMPQSLAICLGQTRMPKADLPFIIYDQNNKYNKFIKTVTLK